MNGTDPARRDDPTAAGGTDTGVSANGAGAPGQPAGAWGIRRLEVAQPPAGPWTVAAQVTPGLSRQPDRAARPTPPAAPARDPDPITTELFSLPLFANEPPKEHPPVAPAPTAWRAVPTSAVLRAVLPPSELVARPAPPQVTVATAVHVAMLGAGVSSGTMLPAPAGRSAAATQAVPGAVVGVSPWPDEIDDGNEPVDEQPVAPRPSLPRRVLWEVLVVIGIAVAVAFIYEALSIFLNRSPGLDTLGGLVVVSSAAVGGPLYDSSAWLKASSRNGDGVAGS